MKKNYLFIGMLLVFLLKVNFTSAKIHLVSAYNPTFTQPEGYFVPAVVNAVVGDTIKWVNGQGQGPHTSFSKVIPAGAASWDSGDFQPEGFMYVVKVAGTYHYACHMNIDHMAAKIEVTAPATGLPAIAPSAVSAAYPVPFSGSITIEATGADMITLHNVLGEKVKSVLLQHGQTKAAIDAAALPAGIYFYNIIQEGTIVETRKVVKR